jgi:hypothetical protein
VKDPREADIRKGALEIARGALAIADEMRLAFPERDMSLPPDLVRLDENIRLAVMNLCHAIALSADQIRGVALEGTL